MKEELRRVPTKNYIILGIILVVSILTVYYLYMWFDAYKETKTNMSILDKYMDVINYNELDNFLVENPNTIVYVSILENDKIRNFEKQLKTSFKNKEISNDILYLDITNEYKNSKNVLKEKYSLNDLSIVDVPCIMTFENSKLKSIYSVKDNDYDINRFLSYVNSIYFERYDLNG